MSVKALPRRATPSASWGCGGCGDEARARSLSMAASNSPQLLSATSVTATSSLMWPSKLCRRGPTCSRSLPSTFLLKVLTNWLTVWKHYNQYSIWVYTILLSCVVYILNEIFLMDYQTEVLLNLFSIIFV